MTPARPGDSQRSRAVAGELGKGAFACQVSAIRGIMRHLLLVEDDTVNRRIGGGSAIRDTGSWADQIGPKLTGASPDDYRTFKASLMALDEYRREVWASSDRYLAGISDADLLRTVPSGEQQQTVARAIGILLNHTAIHVGEISAAKGFQGLRGSPL